MLYQRVYEALRDEIVAGTHPVDAKLPSQDELCRRFEVSAITVRRALGMLQDDGYVLRRPKLGTVVVATHPATAPPAPRTVPLLGCVMTEFDDTFGSRVLASILDTAADRADVIVKRSLGDPGAEAAHVSALIESGVDGLILLLTSSAFIAPSVLSLVTAHFPLVILDRELDSVRVSTVASDNPTGGALAARRLFAAGHRRVGLVASVSAVSTVEQRCRGFVQAHAQAAVPFDPADEYRRVESVVPGSTRAEDLEVDQLARWFADRRHLTAVVSTEFHLVQLVARAASRVGLEIPRDLSLVCFDHPPATGLAGELLVDHVRQDQAELGRRAVDQVISQIGRAHDVVKHTVPVTLVPGGTVAQPRARDSVAMIADSIVE